jgi:hypothetical protein
VNSTDPPKHSKTLLWEISGIENDYWTMDIQARPFQLDSAKGEIPTVLGRYAVRNRDNAAFSAAGTSTNYSRGCFDMILRLTRRFGLGYPLSAQY